MKKQIISFPFLLLCIWLFVAFTGEHHTSITQKGAAASLLSKILSDRDVEYIVYHNMLQDGNNIFFNTPERHFDRKLIVESIQYLNSEWQIINQTRDRLTALRAFGRITHAIEDFYAHSNWIELNQNQAVIPTFSFNVNQIPKGLITGWWPDDAPVVKNNQEISHNALNKDKAESISGQKLVGNGPNKGKTLFNLAYDVALRSCKEQYARFTNVITANKVQNTKAYFFKGNQYYRYDVFTDQTDAGYPLPITANWRGLTFSSIDAAINWGNGKVYFFKGNQYIRYDVKADCADAGYPKIISSGWPGLSFSSIDAAIVDERNDFAYFFKGSQYIRYNIKTDRADPDYPQLIAQEWKGLDANNWDSAVNWENGSVYFFKSSQYFKYDLVTNKIISGYPLIINQQWKGLPVSVDASVVWY
jgi:Hemopexin/Heterokaryon incompatibility protein Het-C